MRTSFVPIKKSVDYSKFFGRRTGKRNLSFSVSIHVGNYASRTRQYMVSGRKTHTETCVYAGLNYTVNFGWHPVGSKINH